MTGGLGLIRVSIAMALMAGVLVGCGQADTSRRKNIPTPEAKFDEMEIPGIPLGITQSEVREKYGPPQSVNVAGYGSEVWTYPNPKLGFPIKMFEIKGKGGSDNQGITQAPELTKLDHFEGRPYMGTPYKTWTPDKTWTPAKTEASLRFRDGKLAKVEAVSHDLFGELRVTIDADGKVTWTIPGEKGKADQVQGK